LVAGALPILLSIGFLASARLYLPAAGVAAAGLIVLGWTRAAWRRTAADERRTLAALAEAQAALARCQARLGAAEERAAVADLAGALAHDFNNLLTGIQGYARLLLDRVGPGDPIRRQLAAIVNAAARAADLASQLQTLDPGADHSSGAAPVAAGPGGTAPPRVATAPPTAASGAGAGAAVSPGAPGPRRTILAVDDESTILALAKDVLELEGYRVVVARNGEEALRTYRDAAGGIDLVLLDLTMPVMGGIECLRRLRALDPDVRVVISSGFASEATAAELLRGGALACLQKPYEIQALTRTVATALAREPARQAASG